VVEGSYDDAVRQVALDAAERKWLAVSDTSWPGYEEIPRWIMAGYTQMLREASHQWQSAPDVVLVQAGVGGLACAVASWFADQLRERRPYLIACEPESAACLLEAARIGRPVQISGDLQTVMACLSAGEVSHIAWPILAGTIDCFVAVEDAHAVDAVQLLKREPPFLTAGESGAAGLAGLSAIRNSPSLAPVWQAANLGPRSRVMVFLTEGPAI
jgi:diaminopropionate ammonia-lyase